MVCFFFQAEDGIRDLVRSRGLGDVYKRQVHELHLTYSGPAALATLIGRNLSGFSVTAYEAFDLSLIHI